MKFWGKVRSWLGLGTLMMTVAGATGCGPNQDWLNPFYNGSPPTTTQYLPIKGISLANESKIEQDLRSGNLTKESLSIVNKFRADIEGNYPLGKFINQAYFSNDYATLFAMLGMYEGRPAHFVVADTTKPPEEKFVNNVPTRFYPANLCLGGGYISATNQSVLSAWARLPSEKSFDGHYGNDSMADVTFNFLENLCNYYIVNGDKLLMVYENVMAEAIDTLDSEEQRDAAWAALLMGDVHFAIVNRSVIDSPPIGIAHVSKTGPSWEVTSYRDVYGIRSEIGTTLKAIIRQQGLNYDAEGAYIGASIAKAQIASGNPRGISRATGDALSAYLEAMNKNAAGLVRTWTRTAPEAQVDRHILVLGTTL